MGRQTFFLSIDIYWSIEEVNGIHGVQVLIHEDFGTFLVRELLFVFYYQFNIYITIA